MEFRNIAGKVFTLAEIVDEIKKYVEADQDYVYDLVIGSDSQYHGGFTVFVTAVIIHRVGKGAKLFYTKSKVNKNLDICTKILRETYCSIEVMQKIEEDDIVYALNNYSIHVDAGQNGNSRKILKECISYVHGFGYDCKTKPDAYVASKVADRYTK